VDEVRNDAMPTESDERMAKFKAAINEWRNGDPAALVGIDVTPAELLTISALAKANGDNFAYLLTQRLLARMFGPR